MTTTRTTLIAAAALGALSMAALLFGTWGLADGLQQSSQVPRGLIYHGTLERNGTGLNAAMEMTFSLYDGADTDAAAWVETQTVSVYAGRFSVSLGSTSAASADALAGVVQAADDLHLGIAILDDGDWLALANRQRFLPMPYSHWTWAATDMRIRGVDGVQGDGALLLNADTGGTVEVGANLEIGGTDVRFLASGAGDGGHALSHQEPERLVLNKDGEFAGGVRIDSPLSTLPELIFYKWFSIGGTLDYNTQINVGSMSCVIAGVRMVGGDIWEDQSLGEVMDLYTYPGDDGKWWVRIDFASHKNTHETHEFGLLCFRKGITEIESWW